MNFLVGFEIEFVLLNAKDYTFVNEARWCAADKMPCGSDIVKALDEIMEALEVAGIEVCQYHAEATLSQVTFFFTRLKTRPKVIVVRNCDGSTPSGGSGGRPYSDPSNHLELCTKAWYEDDPHS